MSCRFRSKVEQLFDIATDNGLSSGPSGSLALGSVMQFTDYKIAWEPSREQVAFSSKPVPLKVDAGAGPIAVPADFKGRQTIETLAKRALPEDVLDTKDGGGMVGGQEAFDKHLLELSHVLRNRPVIKTLESLVQKQSEKDRTERLDAAAKKLREELQAGSVTFADAQSTAKCGPAYIAVHVDGKERGRFVDSQNLSADAMVLRAKLAMGLSIPRLKLWSAKGHEDVLNQFVRTRSISGNGKLGDKDEALCFRGFGAAPIADMVVDARLIVSSTEGTMSQIDLEANDSTGAKMALRIMELKDDIPRLMFINKSTGWTREYIYVPQAAKWIERNAKFIRDRDTLKD